MMEASTAVHNPVCLSSEPQMITDDESVSGQLRQKRKPMIPRAEASNPCPRHFNLGPKTPDSQGSQPYPKLPSCNSATSAIRQP